MMNDHLSPTLTKLHSVFERCAVIKFSTHSNPDGFIANFYAKVIITSQKNQTLSLSYSLNQGKPISFLSLILSKQIILINSQSVQNIA